jgi:hypothetical protein
MAVETPYGRMSLAAKQAQHRDRMREPSVTCPRCEVQTTVADLLRHIESGCSGRRPAHPLSKWVTWSEVLELGVPNATFQDWVRRGVVQAEGPARRRRYLLRDVVRLMARRQLRKVVVDSDGTR